MRISGWSHGFGNIMKKTAESIPTWPAKLQAMQQLVTFWKNHTWRTLVRGASRQQNLEGTDALEHVSASFAKWRYETITQVTKELSRMRPFGERVVRHELFKDPQDKSLMDSVVFHYQDKPLQAFITVTNKFIWKTLEDARRWGMTCDCDLHIQLRRSGARHISCPRNGRNIRHGWAFIQSLIADLRDKANALTLADCEGDLEVYRDTRDMLLKVMGSLRMRFKYLSVAPWSFANADIEEGSALCVEQVQSRPLCDHDYLTRDIWNRLQQDLIQRSTGGPLTPALAQEVLEINDSGVDEHAGEGWHRSSNQEKVRAPASSLMHLKRTLRHKEVISLLKGFLRKKHGQRGERVVRFEWRHWKKGAPS